MPRILKVGKVVDELTLGKVREAAEAIKEGKLVIYPTDTVYGLGTNPFSDQAVRRLIEAKRRPLGKHIPLLVSSISRVEELAILNDYARALAEKFWPGPLTIVLPLRKNTGLSSLLFGGEEENGFRIPQNPIAQALIKGSGGVITGTSANISGRKPPITAQEAVQQLGESVDLVLDGGETFYKQPSTVVKVLKDGSLVIIREGALKIEHIMKFIKSLLA